jgi:hypothetical protein
MVTTAEEVHMETEEATTTTADLGAVTAVTADENPKKCTE